MLYMYVGILTLNISVLLRVHLAQFKENLTLNVLILRPNVKIINNKFGRFNAFSAKTFLNDAVTVQTKLYVPSNDTHCGQKPTVNFIDTKGIA